VSLQNPRLGFVCTAQTTDGQHGLAGYFLEHDRDLASDERLRFSPGEMPPPFDAAAAPRLPAQQWPAERLAKASRNYAMEYIRTGLPRLAEVFGPGDATALGRAAAFLVGAQAYAALAGGLGITDDTARAFGDFLASIARAEGDEASASLDGDAVIVRRRGWRLMRGINDPARSVFDGWNGLFEGTLAVHNRFLALEVLQRPDYGDPVIEWRIRKVR
jgi:hypothetical protein